VESFSVPNRTLPVFIDISKSETYSFEGGNADLRPYPARLHRTSRRFPRCFKALAGAVELFVYFYNKPDIEEKPCSKASGLFREKLVNTHLVTPEFINTIDTKSKIVFNLSNTSFK
jgi:hypothetical protein